MPTIQQDFFAVAEPEPGQFACTSKSVQRRLDIQRPECERTDTGLRAPAANADPLSSKLAAGQVEKSGLDRYMIARRMSEAEALGLVVRAEKMKVCSVSNKLAQTWSVK